MNTAAAGDVDPFDGYEPSDEELSAMRRQHAICALVEAIVEKRPVPAWIAVMLAEDYGGDPSKIPAWAWKVALAALEEAGKYPSRDPETTKEITSEVAANRGWHCDPWMESGALVAQAPPAAGRPRQWRPRPARRRLRARARSPDRPGRRTRSLGLGAAA